MKSEELQKLMGLTSPLEPKLVEYLQQLVADKGLEYVKDNKQLLLNQWEYIRQLGV
jgi:hypothetical protein